MRNPAKDSETERLAAKLVDAALKVHRNLGPGLLESVYEACLCHELCLREIPFKRQVSVPIIYEGVTLDVGLRLDVVVPIASLLKSKPSKGSSHYSTHKFSRI